MIAFFLAITFVANLEYPKSARESLHKRKVKKISDKKDRKNILPKNADGCYGAYKALCDGLEFSGRLNVQPKSVQEHHKSKITKIEIQKVESFFTY
jgi:hypothetical protein